MSLRKVDIKVWVVGLISILIYFGVVFYVANIGKAPKNYYKIGEIYHWEFKEDPFLSEEERNNFIYIIDKKEGYVKYVYIDNPNDYGDITQISDDLHFTKNMDILYPYYKKLKK